MSAGLLAPSRADAQGRADHIRTGLARIEATYQDLGEAVATAYHERDWGTLGYGSWDAYVEGEFAGHLPKLNREERGQFVRELRDAGLSVRAIGSVTGASVGTVHSDLGSGVQNRTPAAEPPTPTVADDEDIPGVGDSDGASFTNSSTPAPPALAPRPASVIRGADGKRYASSRAASSRPQFAPAAAEDEDVLPGIVTGAVISDQELADAGRDAELDAQMAETAARFRRNFSAALARADDVWQFDVDRIAELYSADFDRDLRPWLEEMERWCERVTDSIRRHRSGLRVVQGGAR